MPNKQEIFICLEVPSKAEKAYEHIKGLEDDLHVTVIFVPDATTTDEKQQQILQAISKVAKEFDGVECEFTGLGNFDNGDDTYVAFVNIPDGAKLNTMLEDAVKKVYGDWEKDYGFIPHVTLKYKGDGTSDIDDLRNVKWTAKKLRVQFDDSSNPLYVDFGSGNVHESKKKEATVAVPIRSQLDYPNFATIEGDEIEKKADILDTLPPSEHYPITVDSIYQRRNMPDFKVIVRSMGKYGDGTVRKKFPVIVWANSEYIDSNTDVIIYEILGYGGDDKYQLSSEDYFRKNFIPRLSSFYAGSLKFSDILDVPPPHEPIRGQMYRHKIYPEETMKVVDYGPREQMRKLYPNAIYLSTQDPPLGMSIVRRDTVVIFQSRNGTLSWTLLEPRLGSSNNFSFESYEPMPSSQSSLKFADILDHTNPIEPDIGDVYVHNIGREYYTIFDVGTRDQIVGEHQDDNINFYLDDNYKGIVVVFKDSMDDLICMTLGVFNKNFTFVRHGKSSQASLVFSDILDTFPQRQPIVEPIPGRRYVHKWAENWYITVLEIGLLEDMRIKYPSAHYDGSEGMESLGEVPQNYLRKYNKKSIIVFKFDDGSLGWLWNTRLQFKQYKFASLKFADILENQFEDNNASYQDRIDHFVNRYPKYQVPRKFKDIEEREDEPHDYRTHPEKYEDVSDMERASEYKKRQLEYNKYLHRRKYEILKSDKLGDQIKGILYDYVKKNNWEIWYDDHASDYDELRIFKRFQDGVAAVIVNGRESNDWQHFQDLNVPVFTWYCSGNFYDNESVMADTEPRMNKYIPDSLDPVKYVDSYIWYHGDGGSDRTYDSAHEAFEYAIDEMIGYDRAHEEFDETTFEAPEGWPEYIQPPDPNQLRLFDNKTEREVHPERYADLQFENIKHFSDILDFPPPPLNTPLPPLSRSYTAKELVDGQLLKPWQLWQYSFALNDPGKELYTRRFFICRLNPEAYLDSETSGVIIMDVGLASLHEIQSRFINPSRLWSDSIYIDASHDKDFILLSHDWTNLGTTGALKFSDILEFENEPFKVHRGQLYIPKSERKYTIEIIDTIYGQTASTYLDKVTVTSSRDILYNSKIEDKLVIYKTIDEPMLQNDVFCDKEDVFLSLYKLLPSKTADILEFPDPPQDERIGKEFYHKQLPRLNHVFVDDIGTAGEMVLKYKKNEFYTGVYDEIAEKTLPEDNIVIVHAKGYLLFSWILLDTFNKYYLPVQSKTADILDFDDIPQEPQSPDLYSWMPLKDAYKYMRRHDDWEVRSNNSNTIHRWHINSSDNPDGNYILHIRKDNQNFMYHTPKTHEENYSARKVQDRNVLGSVVFSGIKKMSDWFSYLLRRPMNEMQFWKYARPNQIWSFERVGQAQLQGRNVQRFVRITQLEPERNYVHGVYGYSKDDLMNKGQISAGSPSGDVWQNIKFEGV